MSMLAISKEELAWNPVEGLARYARARQAVAKCKPNDPPPNPAPVKPNVNPVVFVPPVHAPKPTIHPLACIRYPAPICGPCKPSHVAFECYQHHETLETVERASIEDCIRYVCVTYDLTKQELIGQQRHASVVLPRHIAMYLAKKYAARSLPEIGRRMGDRDHTTILHGIRRIKKMIDRGEWSLPPIETVLNWSKQKP